MTKEDIARINALAKKQREAGLTPEEKEEQSRLRQAYLAAFRENLKAQLDNVYIEQADGTYQKLQKKGEPKGGCPDA